MSDIPCTTRASTEETLYSALLNEYQVEQLASGFVPASVKAQMMDFLTWREIEEAKAKRPYEKAKRRGNKTARVADRSKLSEV